MAQILQEGDANQGTGLKQIATGTGLTAPAQTDTAMETELDRGVVTWQNANLVNDPPVCTAYYQFQPTEANGDNTETGLFDDAGNMAAHSRYGSGTITGATQGNPVVITSVAHGRTDNDKVRIQSVGGMTEINDRDFWIDVLTADTFALYTATGPASAEDGTGHTAYTSGGEWVLKIIKTAADILQTSWDLTW
jgi:hypothetical protein